MALYMLYSLIFRVKDMEFFLEKSVGNKGYIDVLFVRKSFCSGLGAMETHPSTPQIIDYFGSFWPVLFTDRL